MMRMLSCLVVALLVVGSGVAWAAGAYAISDNHKNFEQENVFLPFKATEPKEANESVCSVTLITGDVVIVSILPDGKRGFAIKPADSTKMRQNFRIFETPKGTYLFPAGIDLRKVDKELFNIDYLVREQYCNLTYLPVLIDYNNKEEKRLGAAEQKELEKEVNITIIKSYHSIPTFSAKLSFEGINKTFKTLVERPEIRKIWLDKKVKASLYESVPLIGAPELWKSGYNGSGLEIAILDTGIDDTHPDLDDMDDNPATFDPKVIVKNDFTDDDTTEDLYGHGTHCAGIAAGTGVAPSEPYPTPIPVPVLTSSLPTSTQTPPNLLTHSLHSTQTDAYAIKVNNSMIGKERAYTRINTTPDAYEPDDNYWLANWIPTDGTKQLHDFHVPGDLDYVKFNATEDERYLIETSDLGYEADTYIYLYDTDGFTEITRDDDSGEGLASRIIWECDFSGTYYVKVRHFSSSASGPNTYYNISVLEGYSLPAEFSDVYSDHGEDTNGDGLYDYLVVDVGVNVTEAGRYRVSGELYEDGTYNSVDYDSNTIYLSEGNQTVQLRFEGIRLRQSKYNGTYDLRYLELYNAFYPIPPMSPLVISSERGLEEKIERGEIVPENVSAMYGEQLDYRYYAWTTSYYNWTDFQEFPRYIGVAPGAYLWNVKVLNQYGMGYESWIIDGIEYAAYGSDGVANTGDEADIISMSLGGIPTDGTDPLSQAVNNAVDQGLVVAVAAGNSGSDYFTVDSPGVAEKVITVGASAKEGYLAGFSSRGPTLDLRVKPDILAPGAGIIAPRASGTSMGYPYNDYYTGASGTSMATPHVAGAAALILQVHPDWMPEEVKNALISTAENLGYNVYQQGGGRIDVPSAANSKILVDPATINFKILDTTNGTITFKNLDTVPHTLTLDVSVREVFDDTQVDCAYLNRTSLSIAPGSSVSVLLMINATSLPDSLYSGKVSATYSGGELHSVFGFSTLNKVTVNKINMEGEPAISDPVVIFSDVEDAWEKRMIQDGITDENGTVTFYLPNGTYNVISGWRDVPGASVYTTAEDISVEGDTAITLDERTVKVIDFDCNKSGQIMSEKSDDVYYDGKYIWIGFGSSWDYPNETRTYITPTNSFKSIFIYSYYPEEYYNESNRWLINAPEWHKLLYNLSGVSENVTFVADYDKLVERTTDYQVALKPEPASWWYHAWHPDMWLSITSIYEMNAPLHRIEWLSSSPVSYTGGYEQYAEWWNETYPDWSYDIPKRSHPTGSKPYFAVGGHPFKSGVKIDIPWEGSLDIYGTISEDTFGNSFANWTRDVSGNLTVIKDGEVIIDHEDIWDHFREYVYFSGTPGFNIILQGNSGPGLSTYARTELNFTADLTADYQPPMITMKVFDLSSKITSALTQVQLSTPTPVRTPSPECGGGGRAPLALYNIMRGGDVNIEMSIEDESNILDATLGYSLDNGSTWNLTTPVYKGITGCKPISGGNRTVVDETYTSPIYSKVKIFMDDTEDNDEIYYSYIFTLKKSNGSEYTKTGASTSTLGDIYDILYYDEDNDGELDLFKSIYIGAYTEDDDTLDVKVEGWNGTVWKCLYGKKIRRYEADLGYMNNTFVSLRANATDSEGNSISQTVIKGFYVSDAEECIPSNTSWNVTISATNQLEPVAVGMHPNATDGYDPEFDVFAQTPVQGKVILLLDEIYSKSIKKTRCYNESVSWDLSIGVPAGQTTNLSWDVPSNVNLTISEGGKVLSPDSQLGEGSHELTVMAELLEYQEFCIDLKAGWNMVSIPVIPDNNSVQAIFGSIPTLDTMPVKTWESPIFVIVDEIEPKMGYWVFTPSDTTICVTGKTITNTTLNLKAGWNMVGTVGMKNLTISEIPNQASQCPAVTWVAPSFVETDMIEPGESAWVFVTTDTIITIGEAFSTEAKTKTMPTIMKMKSVPSATTEEWNLTISAINQLEPVTFGINPDATDGYDSEYDVFTQTPVQGMVIMILDDMYAKEINHDKPIWNLSIGVPKGLTTNLIWNSSLIPKDVKLTIGGVDMKLENNMILEEGSHELSIVASENHPPTASFTHTPQSPLVNETITFNASSSYDPDGNIMNYTWNFGDGNITTTPDPVITHSYSEAGRYTVNLTVRDNDGLTSSTIKNVLVGCGDLNSDGTIDMADVYLLLDQVGNHAEYQIDEDVNCDDSVNMGDVILLLNHVNDPEKYRLTCCEET